MRLSQLAAGSRLEPRRRYGNNRAPDRTVCDDALSANVPHLFDADSAGLSFGVWTNDTMTCRWICRRRPADLGFRLWPQRCRDVDDAPLAVGRLAELEDAGKFGADRQDRLFGEQRHGLTPLRMARKFRTKALLKSIVRKSFNVACPTAMRHEMKMQRTTIYLRHPEVPGRQRVYARLRRAMAGPRRMNGPCIDAAPPGAVALRGSLRSHLRVTGRGLRSPVEE